jgi:hypothetical protein
MVELQQQICGSILCIFGNILCCIALAGQVGSGFGEFSIVIIRHLSCSSPGIGSFLSIWYSYTASIVVAVFSIVYFITDNIYS